MLIAVAWAFLQQTPADPAPSPPPAPAPSAWSSSSTSWVTGPSAPTSTTPLPPSLAPREGDKTDEPLVVPPVPPEDARVVVDDGLFAPLPELRPQTTWTRSQLARQAALDLDTFLATTISPGLTWLPRSAARALPTSRGHRFGDIAVVVDGVPLIDGAFTEQIGLLAPARLTFHAGPRAVTPLGARGGVLEVDTGGALDDVGESGRVDGVLGVGAGGADNEKGVFALGRSGWRRLRVVGHATLLQREDLRTGRVDLFGAGNDVDAGSVVLRNTGGVGGNVGARVDVVPFDASRLFLTWQAGRSLDAGDPVGCPVVDADGRAVDCVRARERGSDVVIAGFDVRRDFFGVDLQPGLRIHAQRSVDDEERSGSGLVVVDRGVDNVVRGGFDAVVRGRVGDVDFFGADFVTGVDVVADRYDSIFTTRSLRAVDAEPEEGLLDPLRASFVDDATVRAATVHGSVVVQTAFVDVSVGARLQGQFIDTPNDARADVHSSEFAPAADAAAVVHLVDGVDVRAAVGHVARPQTARQVLAIVPAPVGDNVVDDFVEGGVVYSSAAVDASVTAWGSLRTEVHAAGAAGSLRLKPDVDGLDATGYLAGLVADNDDGPVPNALQPQAGMVLRYQPSSLPAGFFFRVSGALPQNRLSADEQLDPQLCPERDPDQVVAQQTACSGAPGFAVVDVGAFVAFGQLRIDAVGENLTDTQGIWRNAATGTGGQAVRLRVAFLF